MLSHRAKDLLRANALGDLPAETPRVARNPKDFKRAKLLSPVLRLGGKFDHGALLAIADRYRNCVSYLLDHRANTPSRIADLARANVTLAAALYTRPERSH